MEPCKVKSSLNSPLPPLCELIKNLEQCSRPQVSDTISRLNLQAINHRDRPILASFEAHQKSSTKTNLPHNPLNLPIRNRRATTLLPIARPKTLRDKSTTNNIIIDIQNKRKALSAQKKFNEHKDLLHGMRQISHFMTESNLDLKEKMAGANLNVLGDRAMRTVVPTTSISLHSLVKCNRASSRVAMDVLQKYFFAGFNRYDVRTHLNTQLILRAIPLTIHSIKRSLSNVVNSVIFFLRLVKDGVTNVSTASEWAHFSQISVSKSQINCKLKSLLYSINSKLTTLNDQMNSLILLQYLCGQLFPAIKALNFSQRIALCKELRITTHKPDRRVIKIGGIAERVYFILSGQVQIIKLGLETYESVGYLNTGEIFGNQDPDLAKLKSSRKATITTTTTTDLLDISERVYNEVIADISTANDILAIRKYLLTIPLFSRLEICDLNRISSLFKIRYYDRNTPVVVKYK